MNTLYIKSLGVGARSIHNFSDSSGHADWPKPIGEKQPGDWKPPVANKELLKPHHYGYHLAKISFVADWFQRENYIAEAGGNIVEGYDCVVSEKARLLRRLYLSPQDYIDIAIAFNEQIFDLLDVMEMSRDMRTTVKDAFRAASTWLLDNPNSQREKENAQKLCRLASLIFYRHATDAQGSHQYLFNSKAAMHVGKSIALLGQLDPLETEAAPYSRFDAIISPFFSKIPKPEIIDNFQIVKDIASETSQAAFNSVMQLTMFQATGRYSGQKLISFLSDKQKTWIERSTLVDKNILPAQALSGIRSIQSDILLEKWGIKHLKHTT